MSNHNDTHEIGTDTSITRRSILQTFGGLGAAGLAGIGSARTDTTGQQQTSSVNEWIQLFNGENLDGLTPKFAGYDVGENYNDTFTIEDGLLTVNYDQYDDWSGTFGHLFYEDEFSHYILR